MQPTHDTLAAPTMRADFSRAPIVVFFETTRACDLACRHCRACAQSLPDPNELTDRQARGLIEQVATFEPRPILVFTGGDPLKRAGLTSLIRRAAELGLRPALTPSATALATTDALRELRDAGLSRLALSVDGADAETHDRFRGVKGSFERTRKIARDALLLGLSLQINTTMTRWNAAQVDAIAALCKEWGADLWSVFFLVPVGRGQVEDCITPAEYEDVFARIWAVSQSAGLAVKTTEAPHYRRFVLQRQTELAKTGASVPPRRPLMPTNDGKGVMFISAQGEIYPSGFLPIECGRFPLDSVVDVYRTAALFKMLRDPENLTGKCADCEYKQVCGGSRARTFAIDHDPFAQEPHCTYQPQRHKELAICST